MQNTAAMNSDVKALLTLLLLKTGTGSPEIHNALQTRRSVAGDDGRRTRQSVAPADRRTGRQQCRQAAARRSRQRAGDIGIGCGA